MTSATTEEKARAEEIIQRLTSDPLFMKSGSEVSRWMISSALAFSSVVALVIICPSYRLTIVPSYLAEAYTK